MHSGTSGKEKNSRRKHRTDKTSGLGNKNWQKSTTLDDWQKICKRFSIERRQYIEVSAFPYSLLLLHLRAVLYSLLHLRAVLYSLLLLRAVPKSLIDAPRG